MLSIGFAGAATTGGSSDGGIDVLARDAAAQVKFQATPVGSPEVQRLKGAAHSTEHLLFYSASPFTPAAREYADTVGMGLFRFEPFGRVQPDNAHARTMLERGLKAADETAERRELLVEMVLITKVSGFLSSEEYMRSLDIEILRSIDESRLGAAGDRIRAARVVFSRDIERTSTPRLHQVAQEAAESLIELGGQLGAPPESVAMLRVEMNG